MIIFCGKTFISLDTFQLEHEVSIRCGFIPAVLYSLYRVYGAVAVVMAIKAQLIHLV